MGHSSRSSLTPAALALIGIVAVSIAAGILSYRTVQANRNASVLANQMRLGLLTYMTLVLDEETAVRAYDATGGTSAIDFLQPYRDASGRYPMVLRSLLSGKIDPQLARVIPYVRQADALHSRWLAEVARPILAHPQAARIDESREERGKLLIDRIRGEVAAAQRIIEDIATERRSASTRAVAVSIVVIVFFVIVAGGVALRSERRFQAQQRALRMQVEERNAALERSNAALQEFAYVASHDLQEPLRAVASFTQLLRKRYGDSLDATANEFMDFAADGAVRMQRLIDDILAYSRVTTHGKPLESTDLGGAAERAIANLQYAIKDRSADVRVGPLPCVQGDSVQLTQLFQNLIGNALKYGGDAPAVAVSAAREGEVWRVSVKDNGIGIAPEYRERVFRIFQRLHTRAEYSGTGVGLAICKGIVERHGGRIWVESNDGQGAAFCFTLHPAKENS